MGIIIQTARVRVRVVHVYKRTRVVGIIIQT